MSTRRKCTGSHTAKKQLLFSKYHPQRSCGNCVLCGKCGVHYTHFGALGEDEKQFIAIHFGRTPSPDSCICKAHHAEAKRYWSHGGYTPKWKELSSTVTIHTCIHPQCLATSAKVKLVSPAFEEIDNLEAALCVERTSDVPFLVCPKHYQELYRQFKSAKPCAGCGVKPKSGTYFTRHSPNASAVSQVLHESSGYDRVVLPTDYLCSTCYKVHLAVLNSLERELNTPDNVLRDSIEVWEYKVSQGDTDKLTNAVLQAVLYVAKELVCQRAVLLPVVSQVFLKAYDSTQCGEPSNAVYLDVGEGIIKYSSQWLLNQLIVHLQQHMRYKCIHKRFGTVLFRTGGDLLTSLSWALGRASVNEATHGQVFLEPGVIDMDAHKENVLSEAGDIINDLIHMEVDKLCDDLSLASPSQFNIDQIIQDTNTLLWKFLVSATRTVRERHSCAMSCNNATTTHKKRIRRFFILCQLMYCTNSRKPTPLHTLLADVIEMCGGSRNLIKVLNQLGAVSSTDTHDRFVTAVAERQRERDVWHELPNNVFTIATADNFDMLQSHAAVYCGDQHRSYHGTTIQLVQPDPKPVLPLIERQSTRLLTTIEEDGHEFSMTMAKGQVEQPGFGLPYSANECASTQEVIMTEGQTNSPGNVLPVPSKHILRPSEDQGVGVQPPGALGGQPVPLRDVLRPSEDQGVGEQPPGALGGQPVPLRDVLRPSEDQGVGEQPPGALGGQPVPLRDVLRPSEDQGVGVQPLGALGGQPVPLRDVLRPSEDQGVGVQPPGAVGGLVNNETPVYSQSNLLEPNQCKRKGKWSPASSPHKLGKVGPKRRRTVTVHGLHVNQARPTDSEQLHSRSPLACPTSILSLEGFQETLNEKIAKVSLESKIYLYMVGKQAFNREDGSVLKELKDIFALTEGAWKRDPSNIYYMEILDENPDSNDTMRLLAGLLLEHASSDHQDKYVVLVGDGKTYDHLMQIKRLYGFELQKLLIFPGDWHTLKNYQPVIMKIYYSVGLKELAKASGYRGETLTSLEKCSHFKRTHHFLLQAWQGMYRQMLHSYLTEKNAFPHLSSLYTALQQKHVTPTDFLATVEGLLSGTGQTEFVAFVEKISKADDTWKFWAQFVLQDCLAYVGLFLAIRCQNWKLRVSSLKRMAPLFAAYDRTTYQRLIPNHLADIQTYPTQVLQCMQAGAFAVSIRGVTGHSVALDEAHEMCINRDMKAAVVRPTKAYLQKTSMFLRYRIAAYKNILQQLFPGEPETSSTPGPECLTTTEAVVTKREDNIQVMIKELDKNAVLPHNITHNRGLLNVFTGTVATPQQAHDLLNFRQIGSDDLIQFINHHILKKPSTAAPIRRNRLLTMAPPIVGKQRMSHKEKELKQVAKCLRRRLAWCNRTGQSYDPAHEQYSMFPRAISDENGYPHKGNKSLWTEKLNKRYNSPHLPVIINNLPHGWSAQAVVIDGMFLINCKPLRHTSIIAEYAILLFNRFILPQYQAGATEVHLVFDAPSKQPFSPKCYERKRRDQSHPSTIHSHLSFTPSTKVPQAWNAHIECRQCKRAIIEAIGLAYLQSARFRLQHHQYFILSGCMSENRGDVPWVITGGNTLPVPDLKYLSNAEEADMMIWRHVTQSSAQRILVYSPDTDVYNIGLPIIQERRLSIECIVQLNVPHSQVLKYLHINNLIQALEDDPDLASLPRDKLPTIIQKLFICSGCDYVSYFRGHGKAAFFNTFCQHASFISGNQSPGILSENMEEGFLAFVRLIGTLYFKKHLSSFVSLHGVETSTQLYHSIDPTKSIEERHKAWYSEIRSTVGDRITNEEERVPSQSSMWRHWQRSCWVSDMWKHSTESDIFTQLNTPEHSGWKHEGDGNYVFDWDSPEVQKQVQDTIGFLTKGCSCKKGCKTKQCGCRKKERHCGPGCDCQGCTNLLESGHHQSPPGESEDDSEVTDQEDLSSQSCSSSEGEDDNALETEVVTDPFDDLLLEEVDIA